MTKEEGFVRIIFELMPIFFAALAFVHCSLQLSGQPTFKDKVIFTLACINATLLIVTQISWSWTVYVGDTVGTLMANYTWTIFNTSVMISYLLMASKDKT
jgi:hypothetical protein